MPMDFLKRMLFISWYIIGRTKSGQGVTNEIDRGFCRGNSEGKTVRPTTQLAVFLPCLCSFQSTPCPQNSSFILLAAQSLWLLSIVTDIWHFLFLPHLVNLYLLSSFCLQDFSSLCEVVSFEYICDVLDLSYSLDIYQLTSARGEHSICYYR